MGKVRSGEPLVEARCSCLLGGVVVSNMSFVFVIGYRRDSMRKASRCKANMSWRDTIGAR